MSAHSTPPQPCAVIERETEDHTWFAGDTVIRPGADAGVVMEDVTVAPGSGRPWHTHPAPTNVISIEGAFAFLVGHGGQTRVVTVPAGVSVHIPADLPHAYTNTSKHRGRLFVAVATDRASFAAQSGHPGRMASHLSTADKPSGVWRRVLVRQYHLAETRFLVACDPTCCTCGAAAQTQQDMPYVRQQDAWFCADCWHRLSATEVESAVRDIALRGVPLC